MKKQNADKELLNEVLNWGEKAFAELGDGRRSKKTEPEVLQRLNSSFKTLRADIAARQARGVKLAMEKLLKKAGLGAPEIQAVYIALYSKLLDRNAMQISSLIRAVSGLNDLSSTDAAALFRPRCPLFKSRIMLPGYDGFPANAEFSSYFLHIALGLPVGKARRKAQNLQKISPRQIYGQLSERVIGQEDAKRRVSAAVFRHLKACQLNLKRKPGDRIQKANILIIGPTGTGKTHIARTLSQILKAPLAVCDATQYTEAGYVGMDVEEMLVQLLKAAGNDPERMKNGIIYLDEIDKIASRDARASHYTTKDVSGLSVQQELLKLLDGDVINYRKRSAISESGTAGLNT
ncbi:MAG: AAA family ATPase [Elusimicrobia bacterium]|nr:AAA family ATPase [Elusimicrobiota bacterium]